MTTRADRDFVSERAGLRCEYCRAPQVVTGVTFHIEHIIPKTQGGIDDRTNYALSCVACNGHKADRTTGVDPQTGDEVPIFHPRRDRWRRHFRFVQETLEIRGISSKGRATVDRLRMNERQQTEARPLWVELEIYP